MSNIDKSGLFYAYNPVNSPDTENESGYLFVIARSSTYKKCYSCLTTNTHVFKKQTRFYDWLG